jgi:hypothetical protein
MLLVRPLGVAVLAGAEPYAVDDAGERARAAKAVRGPSMLIRALVITASVLCADETPLRVGSGPKTRKRYLLAACTNLLTCYFLGDRSMKTFDAFVFPQLDPDLRRGPQRAKAAVITNRVGPLPPDSGRGCHHHVAGSYTFTGSGPCSGLDLSAPMFAPCLLGCPGTPGSIRYPQRGADAGDRTGWQVPARASTA